MFPLAAQIVKCFVILTAGGSHRIPQHVRVLIKIVLVLDFFEGTGWLDTITRTHLLVLVLSIDAFLLFLDDVEALRVVTNGHIWTELIRF